jgi:hypothetical protein
MQTQRRNHFVTTRAEGAILPVDLLQRIAGDEDGQERHRFLELQSLGPLIYAVVPYEGDEAKCVLI